MLFACRHEAERNQVLRGDSDIITHNQDTSTTQTSSHKTLAQCEESIQKNKMQRQNLLERQERILSDRQKQMSERKVWNNIPLEIMSLKSIYMCKSIYKSIYS